MRREGRLNVKSIDQRPQPGGVEPPLLEPTHALQQRLGPGVLRCRRPGALAVDAGDLHLLGLVEQVEACCGVAEHLAQVVERQIRDQPRGSRPALMLQRVSRGGARLSEGGG
ncbi:hypothetical protein J4558_23020 [Leptolyngbya sp. 15MV]|nr:hypothetical protein J4558_23020 [Leptolyngbya sp. 15MV]